MTAGKPRARVYTRRGDDGTTGLLFGGRVPKTSAVIEAAGSVDEAQAFLGLARAEAERGSELDEILMGVERDLWVLMAEVAAPGARDRLEDGRTRVTAEMVAGLERRIDALMERFEMPAEFVLPGQGRTAAALDLARTVIRRAERRVLDAAVGEDSLAATYLNRLSDLCWVMARWQEGEHLLSRSVPSPS